MGFYTLKKEQEKHHTHAFNALTWWLKGNVTELKLNAMFDGKNQLLEKTNDITKNYFPSIIPKYTSRSNFHKVVAHKNTYGLTFRVLERYLDGI